MERAGRRSEFYRAARAGSFVRLTEGVYMSRQGFAALSADDRFLAQTHAVSLSSRPGLVFSHLSAAALWRLPLIGTWPTKPEVVVGRATSSPSRHAFTARQFPLPAHPDEIDGLLVTSLSRTAIDVGRSAPIATAVAMMDRALAEKDPATSVIPAHVLRADLAAEFRAIDSPRGRSRCRNALEIADGRSGSPGESLSRVGFHLLGLPAPVLQQAFYDADGLIGYVDFWWPEFGLIGEFDGNGKYFRDELLDGRTTADVVMAEKRRENRLRALGPRVTRWGWDVARSLRALGRHVEDAGLR